MAFFITFTNQIHPIYVLQVHVDVKKNLSAALSHIKFKQEEQLEAIIAGCLQGNRVSQERLYKLMYPKMMSMVKRYTNYHQYHLAEEILNNGFLKVFQKIESYQFKGSFEGWVRKIIYHSIFDYVRQTTKYNDQIVFVDKDATVDKTVIDKINYDDIMQLVQELPNNTRAVFNMYVMEGYSHKEISELLEISEGTSKWHLHEGRKILKTKIEFLNK